MKSILNFIRSSQVFNNSFWSVFEVLVLPVLMLVATPFFLARLGEEQYGQWMLINSVIASLGILNMGLGEATIRFIAKYNAVDLIRTVKVANTTYAFYLAMSLLGFFLGYTYLILEENTALFFDSGKNAFIGILKLGILLFGLRLIEQIIFSIYKGFERYDLFSKFSIASKTILIVVNIVIVYLGYSLKEIFLFSILSSLVFLVVEFIFLKKFLPGFSILPSFDKAVFLEIMNFGLWSWVQSIIGILSYQMDKFMVAGLAGVKVLAYYSIGFSIATQLFNIFVAASNWMFPKVSKNALNKEHLNTLYRKSQFLLISSACISIAIFYLVKNPVLTLWLGPENSMKALPYIDSYCIFILMTSLTIIPSFFMLGTSNMKLMTANSIFSIIVTLLMMFFIFRICGPIGLVYGRILSAITTIPIFLLVFHRVVLPVNYRFTTLEIAIPFLFAAVLFFKYVFVTIIAIIAIIVGFIWILSLQFRSPQINNNV